MRWLILLLLLPHLALAAASNAYTSARDTVRLVSQSNDAPGGELRLALEFSLQPGGISTGRIRATPDLRRRSFPRRRSRLARSRFRRLNFYSRGRWAPMCSPAMWCCRLRRKTWRAGLRRGPAGWCAPISACRNMRILRWRLRGGPSAEAGLFTPPAIVPSPFAATLAPDGTLSIAGPGAAQVRVARFFPLTPGGIVNAAPQPLSFTATGLALHLQLAQPEANLPGVLELTDPSGQTQALSLTPEAAPEPGHAPYWALALLGGLILNLMPCVFPILAMKACAFARLGGAAHGHIRREALGYGAGRHGLDAGAGRAASRLARGGGDGVLGVSVPVAGIRGAARPG